VAIHDLMEPAHMNVHLPSLLEYFWLRPETAVWRALDFAALDGIEFRRPSLDLGCGDGAFSFMRAGGRYSLSYDFSSMTTNRDQFFDNKDIYDHFEPGKVSDVVDVPPQYKIDVGLDHKPSLLQKARLTSLYDKTVACDANAYLPFARESFATVYSNILYWLDDYPNTLSEIARLLKPGGRCIVQVPTDRFQDFSFYQQLYVKTNDPKWEWLKLLDRGRSENIRNCMSQREWTAKFEAAGLAVEFCKAYLPKLVIQAWDIGLRPISPLLIEMADASAPEKRLEIKKKWITTLLPMLAPLCDISDVDNGFFLFSLVSKRL
jgi:SAM-dependent methyltransferase